MTGSIVTRMIVAVGIGAVAIFALSGRANAQPPPKQEAQRQEDQKESAQNTGTHRSRQHHKQQQHAQQKQDRKQDTQLPHAQPQGPKQGRSPQHAQARLGPQDQQQLIRLQQQRLVQYRDYLDQRQRLAVQQSARLQQQNRLAQYRFQQEYVARLRQQQARLESQDRYDYDRDPYFYTPPSYRYSREGRYYETNQYGVDLLRQAVNHGYEEGWRAGRADRQDRWDSSYEDSYAYQDANYGYAGFYVDRDDYNAYFREGFRRGYEDGYDRRSQYGRYSNGKGTILSAVLAALLHVESIR